MKFQVEIPDDVFWAIAERAEAHDMKVHEFAAEVVISAAAVKQPIDDDPVIQLWRRRFTDRDIARTLGMTNAAVASRRQRYRLPANRRAKGVSYE